MGIDDGQNKDWKQKLPSDVYHVTREKGTEPPFSGKFVDHKEKGKYTCSNCGEELFSSDVKYDSGTGWPSFAEAKPGSVEFVRDGSGGMERTEVVCKKCRAHLGHVFDDGPGPTCQRFCVNSLSLGFQKEEGGTEQKNKE